MKPVLQVIEAEDGFTVEISKNIYGLSKYDMAKEIKKFYTSEVKQLESTIESCVLELLDRFGIIPYDDTEEAIKSAIDKLFHDYEYHIVIEDSYEKTTEKIVHKKKRQTCIIDEYKILSIANKVYLEKGDIK